MKDHELELIAKYIMRAIEAQKAEMQQGAKVSADVTLYELAFLEDVRAGKAVVLNHDMFKHVVFDLVEYWKQQGDIPDWIKEQYNG